MEEHESWRQEASVILLLMWAVPGIEPWTSWEVRQMLYLLSSVPSQIYFTCRKQNKLLFERILKG